MTLRTSNKHFLCQMEIKVHDNFYHFWIEYLWLDYWLDAFLKKWMQNLCFQFWLSDWVWVDAEKWWNKALRPTMRPQEFLGHGKNWAKLIHKRNIRHFSLWKHYLQTYRNLSTAIATFGGRHARELFWCYSWLSKPSWSFLYIKFSISCIFHESITYIHTDRRTDRRTDGRTDGRTHPLIEMRGRI